MLLFFPPRAAVRGHVFAHPLCVCASLMHAHVLHIYIIIVSLVLLVFLDSLQQFLQVSLHALCCKSLPGQLSACSKCSWHLITQTTGGEKKRGELDILYANKVKKKKRFL